MTKTFDDNHPIILGLCGSAGTGKTSVADTLVPSRTVQESEEGILWDHFFFASPLYELVSIKVKTEGDLRKDRIRFGVHEVLFDLFNRSPLYGLPRYNEFTDLVNTITDTPLSEEKPRDFFQNVGDICRSYSENCFINKLKLSVLKGHALAIKDREDTPYVAVVSDIRFPNEAAALSKLPNSVIIKLTATEETRKERLLDRDGFVMSDDQKNHISEQVDRIPLEFVDHVIETDTMDIKEVTEVVKSLMLKNLEGVPVAALK